MDASKFIDSLLSESPRVTRYDTDSSGEDRLQRWFSANNIHRLEGDRGMENLEKLCKALGYRDEGFRWGSPIERFLSDNSGAMEKIIEFISEWVDRSPEWAEALRIEDDPEDEPEDVEDMPGDQSPLPT